MVVSTESNFIVIDNLSLEYLGPQVSKSANTMSHDYHTNV